MWMNLSLVLILHVVCRLRRQAIVGDDIMLTFCSKVKLVSLTKTFVSAELFVDLDLIEYWKALFFIHVLFTKKCIDHPVCS
jgi:hypothetical protein